MAGWNTNNTKESLETRLLGATGIPSRSHAVYNWQKWFDEELIKRYEGGLEVSDVVDENIVYDIDAEFAQDYIDRYLKPRFDTSRSMSEFVSYMELEKKIKDFGAELALRKELYGDAGFMQFVTPEEYADYLLDSIDPATNKDEWQKILEVRLLIHCRRYCRSSLEAYPYGISKVLHPLKHSMLISIEDQEVISPQEIQLALRYERTKNRTSRGLGTSQNKRRY